MKKVGVGIIGTGHVARLHARGYKALDNAEVVAVCDVVEGRAEAFAKEFGIKNWFVKHSDMLKLQEVDGVDIILPHYLHAPVAIEAAEAGKHIAVQKPMALNLRECEQMVSAARKANVKLSSEECEIFLPPVRKAKELIDVGEIGEPVQLMMSRVFGIPNPTALAASEQQQRTSQTTELNWRKDVKLTGGRSGFDDGWHMFAVARFLLGEPMETHSFLDLKVTGRREMPTMTTWKCQKQGRHGAMCRILLPELYIWSEDRGPYAQQMEVLGKAGIVWVNRGSEGRLLKTAPLVLHKGKYPGETIAYDNIDDMYWTGFREMERDWAESILEDRRPLHSGEDGVMVMRFLLSSYRSAKEGRPVRLDSIGDWDWEEYYQGIPE